MHGITWFNLGNIRIYKLELYRVFLEVIELPSFIISSIQVKSRFCIVKVLNIISTPDDNILCRGFLTDQFN